jgi:hypothetical protein
MVDALSQLPNNFEHVVVLDQTNGAHLFTLQLQRLHNVYEYMLKGMMLKIYYLIKASYCMSLGPKRKA